MQQMAHLHPLVQVQRAANVVVLLPLKFNVNCKNPFMGELQPCAAISQLIFKNCFGHAGMNVPTRTGMKAGLREGPNNAELWAKQHGRRTAGCRRRTE